MGWCEGGGFKPVGDDEAAVGFEEGGAGVEEVRFLGEVGEGFGDPDYVEGGGGEVGGEGFGVEFEEGHFSAVGAEGGEVGFV